MVFFQCFSKVRNSFIGVSLLECQRAVFAFVLTPIPILNWSFVEHPLIWFLVGKVGDIPFEVFLSVIKKELSFVENILNSVLFSSFPVIFVKCALDHEALTLAVKGGFLAI